MATKIRKKSIYAMLLILAFSLAGCVNQEVNNNEKIEIMTRYAEEKYGKEFKVEYFQPALDSSYTNTLTLSDGKTIFNVLATEDCSEMSDDYAQEVLNDKLTVYLSEKVKNKNSDIEIHSRITLISDVTSDFEYIKNSDLNEILANGELLKIFVIVKTSGDIKVLKDDLFEIYVSALEFNPEAIEFQTISCDTVGEDLEKSINQYD